MLGLAPMAGGGGNNGTPLTGPGSSLLEAWYEWNLQQEFAPLLYSSDVAAAAVSVTWPTFTSMALRLRVKAGGTGSRSTCTLEWSGDNGGSWTTIGPGLGATVTLPGNVVLNLPTATYTDGQTWFALRASFRDNKNSHHFVSEDTVPTLAKNPKPLVTPYGTWLNFDGVNNMMRCETALAPNVSGGTGKAFFATAALYVDNTSPTSGTGTLFWIGDGVDNHGILAGTLAAGPVWLATRRDDTNALSSRSGGTPATATPYAWSYAYDGGTVTVQVNGSTMFSLTQAPGGNALSSPAMAIVTLGKSFLSAAEGAPLAFTLGSLSFYNGLPSSGDQTIIVNRMRARLGF